MVAAAVLVAVALGALLPTRTFAQGGVTERVIATAPRTSFVGATDLDTLVLQQPPPPQPPAVPVLPEESPITPPPLAPASRRLGSTAGAAVPAPVATSAAAGTGTWALIVGVNDYPGTDHDLMAAANDAAEVRRALVQLGAPESHLLTLINAQASADAIRGGLDWLTANAGPSATAVVFYAGHAVKVDGDTEALVGADDREVDDAEVGARLRSLAARRAWIGIASCFGGGFTEALAPGRILTGAAPANGLAYENSRFGRSYMVEYMVRQALVEGRSAPNVQAAYAYAVDALNRDYPGRAPVQMDQSDGTFDLRSDDSAPPPAPPPPPQAAPAPPPTSTPPPRQNCLLGLCRG